MTYKGILNLENRPLSFRLLNKIGDGCSQYNHNKSHDIKATNDLQNCNLIYQNATIIWCYDLLIKQHPVQNHEANIKVLLQV